jgi:tRNA (mo5U34)-methyltransferase
MKIRHKELLKTLERLGPWFQNIKLGDGIETRPSHPDGDYPQNRWNVIEPFIPLNLKGKSVLDIGCNAGFFSIKMKERGADYVLGIDVMPYYLDQARFISEFFNQEIDFRLLSVYDLDQLTNKFDIVIFMGVLYHLRYPLYALDKIRNICSRMMIFQCVMQGSWGPIEISIDYPHWEKNIFFEPNFPKMYFIENQFGGTESNWWFPNRNALVAMLRSAGFTYAHPTPHPEIFICYLGDDIPEDTQPLEGMEASWKE